MAMKELDLGELGVIKQERVVKFQYFGTAVRANPKLTEAVMMDFMEAGKEIVLSAKGIEDPSNLSPEATAALMQAFPLVKDFARRCIHTEDFAEFWQIAMDHGQDSSDIMGVCAFLVEKVTSRPTGGRSGSSTGRPKTGPRSEAASSSKVQHRLERNGRSDLALLVLERREKMKRAAA